MGESGEGSMAHPELCADRAGLDTMPPTGMSLCEGGGHQVCEAGVGGWGGRWGVGGGVSLP